MCGRYVLHTPASFLARRYWNHQMPVGDLVARYNITPGTQILSIRLGEDGKPLFDLAYWGFRPRWAKDKSPTPINARIESLKTPYFRDSFSHQRCVIPASGWYEWVKTADGKQPYYITCSNLGRDEALMFAGIYTPTGIGTSVRAAIITEPAADPISHIHDRQPSLIDPQSLDSWLDPGLTDVGQLRGKVGRVDPGRLEWWPVSTRVNRADAPNDSSLIEPLESQET